jgi:sarcosine oxidase subunit beta
MRTATIVRCWAGLEALMPDQIPVIGPSRVVSNLWHAFGYSGHGFQLSPIVGSLLADLIVDGKSPLPLEAFRADRFNEDPSAAHPGVAS